MDKSTFAQFIEYLQELLKKMTLNERIERLGRLKKDLRRDAFISKEERESSARWLVHCDHLDFYFNKLNKKNQKQLKNWAAEKQKEFIKEAKGKKEALEDTATITPAEKKSHNIAVSIGVEKSSNLVPLPGAITGAKDFAEWADRNGFDVTLLTDEKDRNLDAKAIFDVVNQKVSAGGVDRLFIFFAGHGVSLGADVDFWLLSPSPSDTADSAVNLVRTLRLARRSGIGHIAIFADHCRTMAGKKREGIYGRPILPDLDYRGTKRTEVDRFLAARSGDAAQETTDLEREKAFGIFTEALMTALNGKDADSAEIVRNGQPRRAVTARSLADWIPDAVQLAAEQIPGAAFQRPDPLPGSYPPNVLAWLDLSENATLLMRPKSGDPQPKRVNLYTSPDDSSPLELANEFNLPSELSVPIGSFCRIQVVDIPLSHRQEPISGEVFRMTGDRTIEIGLEPDVTRGEDKDKGLLVPMRTIGIDPDGQTFDSAPRDGIFRVITRDSLTGHAAATYRELLAGDPVMPAGNLQADECDSLEAERLAGIVGRDRFETEVGLTLIGARPEELASVPLVEGVFEEDGRWHVRGAAGKSTSVLIYLGNDRFCATAMFEGFVGTIVVADIGVSHIAYMPAGGSRFDIDAVDPEEARRAMALANVSARNGRFDLAEENAADVAAILRQYKHFNPTLGVFAAYAYDQAGQTEKIVDMIRYFEEVSQTVPYDIVMLSGVERSEIHVPIAPAFPMLTQGWALLDADTLSPAMAAARASLAPTLWTTLRSRGGRKLAEALKAGEV